MLKIGNLMTGIQFIRPLTLTHDYSVGRSRTYVNGVKAVRLGRHGMRNSTIRNDGGKYIIRYHNTDIIAFDPSENTITITLNGWSSRSTIKRVFTTTGVRLFSLGSKTLTKFWLRIPVESELRHAPFVDGIKFDATTLEILNPQIIPDDVRKPELRITKQGVAKFRKLWAPVAERLKREIKMGNIAMRIISEQCSPRYGRYIAAYQSHIPQSDILKPEADLLTLENALLYYTKGYYISSEEDINPSLIVGLERMREQVRAEWAKENGELEMVGGEILNSPNYFRKENL